MDQSWQRGVRVRAGQEETGYLDVLFPYDGILISDILFRRVRSLGGGRAPRSVRTAAPVLTTSSLPGDKPGQARSCTPELGASEGYCNDTEENHDRDED